MVMKKMKQLSVQAASYSAPQITAYSFAVEGGFTLSQESGLPGETPDVNDFGDF